MKKIIRKVGGTVALLMATGLGEPSALSAQSKGPTVHTNQPTFQMPIDMAPQDRQMIQAIRLCVKERGGRWAVVETAPARQSSFQFQAPHDGEYWFQFVTIALDGTSQPANLDKVPPALIVVVDTEAPVVSATVVNTVNGDTFINCDVRDDHADPSSLILEYKDEATGQWVPLSPADARQPTVFKVHKPTILKSKFRVQCQDRARNTVHRELDLSSGSSEGPPPLPKFATDVSSSSEPDSAPEPAPAPMPEVTTLPEPVPAPEPTPAPMPEKVTTAEPTPQPVPEPALEAPPAPEPTAAKPPKPKKIELTSQSEPSEPAKPNPLPKEMVDPVMIPELPPGVDFNPTEQVVPQPPQPEPSQPQPKLQPQVPPRPEPKHGPKTPVEAGSSVVLNTRDFTLDYAVEEYRLTALTKIEFWCTPDDGKTWQPLGDDPDRRSPAKLTLPSDGRYGILAHVGTGMDNPPANAEPAFWVEVDTTPPVVSLLPPSLGTGEDEGTMSILWTASDMNLKETPIRLAYATEHTGPWQPIEMNLKNEGIYRWELPKDVGPTLFIRLEAEDKAGNVGTYMTPTPVVLTPPSPKIKVLGITPTFRSDSR